ncbi:MAG: hypothetical protein JWM80_5327 [Cyanobacteria bacterium RYN_339]|nr:hypothetical protein [Cyanobacteria bacterium RYN_339]
MKAAWLLAGLALALPAGPAAAETLGIRPLGGDYESARTVGNGHWTIEGGAWVPSFSAPDSSVTAADQVVLDRWQQFPAWPEIRGIYGLSEGNEAVAFIGPVIGGAYRRFFLRAEAPWPDEYLQALIQLGGGFNLASHLPEGHIRVPAIFEAGPWTLHVAGGGYYLFNNQPTVAVDTGLEFSPLPDFQVGAMAKLRMDSSKITPFDGIWSFGAGARYRIGLRFVVQADVYQDAGPPTVATSKAVPRVEFPFQGLRATAGYYF